MGATTEEPWGWQARARAVLENRRLMRAGLLDERAVRVPGGVSVTGTCRFPVFPYLYANTPAVPFPQADLDSAYNSTGYWRSGSVQEYYDEVSYELLTMEADVYAWTPVPNVDTYYEGTGWGRDPGTDATDVLIIEVVNSWDGVLDFSMWDNDGLDGESAFDTKRRGGVPDDDGYLDLLVLVTPEAGGECGGGTSNTNIWSHASYLSNWIAGPAYHETNDDDGKGGKIRVNRYQITAGLDCDGTSQRGIGTFCHELGHALDLKDLYDPDSTNGDSRGTGHWSLMGGGDWNTPDSPAHLTAWEKERLGWLTYDVIDVDTDSLCLAPVETNPAALRLWQYGDDLGPEYFVVENRQALGFDQEINGVGLLIYHVDEDQYTGTDPNGDETHKALDVECADAGSADTDDLDLDLNSADATDPWCPSTQVEFDALTVPNSLSYSGNETDVAVRNIDNCGSGSICADYEVGTASTGNVAIRDCEESGYAEVSGCPSWWVSPDIWVDNDGDGVEDLPKPVLENRVWFRVKNIGATALSNVMVQVYVMGEPSIGTRVPSGAVQPYGFPVTISNLVPGEFYEGSVMHPYPFSISEDNYSYGVVVQQPTYNPQTDEYPPNDNNVAVVSCTYVVERVTGPGPGLAPGSFATSTRVLLYSGQPPGGGTVTAELNPLGSPPPLPPSWNWDIAPGMGPFLLSPGVPETVTVYVSSSSAVHGEMGTFPLRLVDKSTGEVIGGLLQNFRIDNVDPQAPANVRPSWVMPGGNDLSGPQVLVEWDKVFLDATGSPEEIRYYEVLGGGSGFARQVAVDADMEAPGFQWYDRAAIKDCNVTYNYTVTAVDEAGNHSPSSAPMVLTCAGPATPASASSQHGASLAQNRPNPFVSGGDRWTRIEYSIDRAAPVRLAVYDTSGRLVRTLVSGEKEPGMYSVPWDGRDEQGLAVAPGIYFYRIEAGGWQQTRKMVVLR